MITSPYINKYCIICPIGNEEDNLGQFLDKLSSLENFYFIGIFDTFSTDQSLNILKDKINTDSRFSYIHLGQAKGLAHAYLCGLQAAVDMNFFKIIEMDIGHPEDKIPFIVDQLSKYDVVFASRFLQYNKNEYSFIRFIISKIGTYMSRYILGMPFSDCTSGFQGFNLHVLKSMKLNKFLSKGHIYQTEMKYYCKNCKFKEFYIPYTTNNSSFNYNQLLEGLYVFFKLFKINMSKIRFL
jgi:dolichol-phosphate mannosyltransferase